MCAEVASSNSNNTATSDLAKEIVDELRASREVYGLLSRLMFSPLSQQEIDALADMDLLRQFPEADSPFSEGLREMARCLQNGSATIRQDLNIDYTSAFYGVNQYEGKVATPYESVFRSEDGLLFQKPYTEVYQSYKRNCVKNDSELNLPADHLSFELQFLGKLCEKAADSLASARTEEARTLLDEQRDFIESHILSWIDDLSAVAGKLVKLDFYRGVLKVVRGFAEDRARMLAEYSKELHGSTA